MSFFTVVSSGLIFSWSHEVIVTKQKNKNRTISILNLVFFIVKYPIKCLGSLCFYSRYIPAQTTADNVMAAVLFSVKYERADTAAARATEIKNFKSRFAK